MTHQIFPAVVRLDVAQETYSEGKRTLRRSVVGRDRNDPDRYIVLAFFDDYESAMVNSQLAETAAFGEKQAALAGGELRFTDLDVIEDRS